MSCQPGSDEDRVPYGCHDAQRVQHCLLPVASQCTKQMVSDGPHPRFKTMQAYGVKGRSPDDKNREGMFEMLSLSSFRRYAIPG